MINSDTFLNHDTASNFSCMKDIFPRGKTLCHCKTLFVKAKFSFLTKTFSLAGLLAGLFAFNIHHHELHLTKINSLRQNPSSCSLTSFIVYIKILHSAIAFYSFRGKTFFFTTAKLFFRRRKLICC